MYVFIREQAAPNGLFGNQAMVFDAPLVACLFDATFNVATTVYPPDFGLSILATVVFPHAWARAVS
jgi:hypothetical protein